MAFLYILPLGTLPAALEYRARVTDGLTMGTRKTKEELFEEAGVCARRFARFHQSRTGASFTEEEIREAALDGYVEVLAEWAGSSDLDDDCLARHVEAALGRQRRQRNRARAADVFDDIDKKQRASVVDCGARDKRVLLRPRPAAARAIAERLEAFEQEIYHAIRGGSLFRTRKVTRSGDYLLGVTRPFAWSVAPKAKSACATDVAAWTALSPAERQRQIEATRPWYEGDEAARNAALDAVKQGQCRLARAVFWRDGNVNGFNSQGMSVIRRALGKAEASARCGRGAHFFAKVSSRKLQRWIVRRARGKRVPLTGDAIIDAGLVERDEVIVLDEGSYYRPVAENVAALAGLTSVNIDTAIEAITDYRRRCLVVRCAVCENGGPSSDWIDCNHNKPKFDQHGRQIAGVDLRGRGGRTPRYALMSKMGGSKGFEKLRFVDYSSDRRIQDAAARLSAWVLYVLGVAPSVRHVVKRIHGRRTSRQVVKVLKAHSLVSVPAGAAGGRHPAFRQRTRAGRQAK